MYYLFLYRKKDLVEFRSEFDRVRKAMDEGKTPTYNEMRATKTFLYEGLVDIPFRGFFLCVFAFVMSMAGVNEFVSVGVTFAINSFLNAFLQFIIARVKNVLRLKLCDRLGVERSERSIAVFESLEYQSV